MYMQQYAKSIRWTLFVLWLCAYFPAIAQVEPVTGAASTAPHTLVLYSYGYGARGVEAFSDGFITAISSNGESVNDTFFEYLDLERNQGKDYRERLTESLLKKYRDRNIAAIVTAQQPALDFLLNEASALAPTAPAITVQAPIPPLA
jgi:hypothetical protein